MRVRFTTDKAAWARACEYAKATNRTPSELVAEALDQMQARYPKRRQGAETDLDAIVLQVAAKLGLQVPAGTLQGNPGGGHRHDWSCFDVGSKIGKGHLSDVKG